MAFPVWKGSGVTNLPSSGWSVSSRDSLIRNSASVSAAGRWVFLSNSAWMLLVPCTESTQHPWLLCPQTHCANTGVWHWADQSTQLWYFSSLVGTHMLYPPCNLIPRHPSVQSSILAPQAMTNQLSHCLLPRKESIYTHPQSVFPSPLCQ